MNWRSFWQIANLDKHKIKLDNSSGCCFAYKLFIVTIKLFMKEIVQVEGVVVETLPGTKFKVKIDEGHELFAHVSGKMRMHYIKILPGDSVIVEMSPYDLTKGRIVKRG